MGYHLRLMMTVVNNIRILLIGCMVFLYGCCRRRGTCPFSPQSWDWICSWRIHDGEGGEGTERLDGREIMEVRCHFSFSSFYRQDIWGPQRCHLVTISKFGCCVDRDNVMKTAMTMVSIIWKRDWSLRLWRCWSAFIRGRLVKWSNILKRPGTLIRKSET